MTHTFLRRRAAAVGLAMSLLLAGCAVDDGGSGPTGSSDATAGDGGSDQGLSAEQRREERRREAGQERDQALAGPSEEHREQAEELVSGMNAEERAGQVLVGQYDGVDASTMAEQIERLHLAGAIVMPPNVPTGADGGVDVEALSGQLERLRAATDDEVPGIVAVDQEGGLVTRVGEPLTEWPTPMAYGAAAAGDGLEGDAGDGSGDGGSPADGTELAVAGHRAMAADLAELGFTMDFAPIADVTVGPADPTIGARSFSTDPQLAGELALAATRGLAEGGLAGSLKHFPGHGSVTEDSHVALPRQDASLEQLRQRDWTPFARGIEAGVPMVMMGHLDVPALEEGVPTSLSSAAYQEVRDMGHDGVIVTDALNMGAIVDGYGPARAPVLALQAGADLLLMPSDVATAHAAVVDAVDSGEVSEDRLRQAAERVVALQLWRQDLADGELAAGPGVETPEVLSEEDAGGSDHSGTDSADSLDSADVAGELAEESATLVSGTCGEDLTGQGIRILGGTATDRARLAAAAWDAGIPTGQGTTVQLFGGSRGSAGGDVAVALDRPAALADSDAETRIALYGRTEESFAALVEVLAGAEAPGRLPAEVGELDVGDGGC
ncbi:glycoside hydrolase family 3 N-terminal domain-containing protein [Nesterenkonia sp. F]|uniref:glycoside hydrolase family 3 N-terminal domain-containing protein n=1 Tax=Nesterenkonia sp. F TaxID=795955 RepID=UPI000255D378|nr:glycoside hydrolase family 3 N-terminal domain-containing protein [Nesterenkonia sp. F]